MKKILLIIFLLPFIASAQNGKDKFGKYVFGDTVYFKVVPYNSGAGIVALGIDTVASSPTFGKLVRKTASGGGSGTVNTGASLKAAYYPSSGTTVDDVTGVEYNNTNLLAKFSTQSTTDVGLEIKLQSSQTANALNISSSGGTADLASVSKDGSIKAGGNLAMIGTEGTYGGIWFGSGVSSPSTSNYSFLFDGTGTIVNAPSAGFISYRINNDFANSVVLNSSNRFAVGYAYNSTIDRKFQVRETDAVTNAVTYVSKLAHVTSGTATTGYGIGQEWELENASGTNRVASTLETIYTDATDATEDADAVLKTIRAGTLTEGLRSKSTGQLNLATYGSGTFTGTAAKWLAVDASGNIIEENTPSGGTPTLTATYVGYGDGSNILTGTSNFVYDNSNKKLVLIDGSADSYIEVGNAGGTFKTTISGAGFTSISTGFLSVLEQSTPATPSGRGIFYFKSDNLPYALNDAGTEMALYNTGGGMADPGGNGIVVRTALNTTINRTMTGTTNEITISNGDGTGGNPTFSIPATFDLSTKSVRIDDLKDPSGNTILGVNYTASANNYLQIDNSNGGSPILSAVGGATDISMNFQMKGAGFYNFLATSSGPTALDLYEDTDNGTNFAQLTVPSSLGSNVTITLPNASSTLPIYPQQMTYTGMTAARTVTYPDANFSAARIDAAQTFTGSQTFASEIISNTAVTASGNAATVAVTASLTTVTNNSAATLTITMATASAVDGQISTVRILDATAATQTITWVNTENSSITAPTTSNGSTTLFLTVKFIYNSATSKWRCIGYA